MEAPGELPRRGDQGWSQNPQDPDKAFEYDKTVQLPMANHSCRDYTTEHDHLYNKLSEHDVTLPNKVQTSTGRTDPRTTAIGQSPRTWNGAQQGARSPLSPVGPRPQRSLEEVNMDILVTFVAKFVAMQFTMRMMSAIQTMSGLRNPTMTMRRATMKMKPTPKTLHQRQLIALSMRPRRTSTMTLPIRPLLKWIQLSKPKSMTQHTPPTSMPDGASMGSSSAVVTCRLWR